MLSKKRQLESNMTPFSLLIRSPSLDSSKTFTRSLNRRLICQTQYLIAKSIVKLLICISKLAFTHLLINMKLAPEQMKLMRSRPIWKIHWSRSTKQISKSIHQMRSSWPQRILRDSLWFPAIRRDNFPPSTWIHRDIQTMCEPRLRFLHKSHHFSKLSGRNLCHSAIIMAVSRVVSAAWCVTHNLLLGPTQHRHEMGLFCRQPQALKKTILCKRDPKEMQRRRLLLSSKLNIQQCSESFAPGISTVNWGSVKKC